MVGQGRGNGNICRTKSTYVRRQCVPSPQGKGVTQRYLFHSFTRFSLLLCIVNRDPYHFRPSPFPPLLVSPALDQHISSRVEDPIVCP